LNKKEFLHLAVSIDHDIIDAQPIAHFISSFVDLLHTMTKNMIIRLYQLAEAPAGYFTTKQAHNVGYSRVHLSALTVGEQFIKIQLG
jgi:hypothetical protein